MSLFVLRSNFKYSPWFQPRETYFNIRNVICLASPWLKPRVMFAYDCDCKCNYLNKKRGMLDASFYILKTINYLTVIGNSTVVLSHPITRFATLP